MPLLTWGAEHGSTPVKEEPPVSFDPTPDRAQGRTGATRRGLFLRTAAVALASAAVGGGIVAAVDRPGATPAAAAATSASAGGSAATAPTGVPTTNSTGPQSMRQIYAERSAGIGNQRERLALINGLQDLRDAF